MSAQLQKVRKILLWSQRDNSSVTVQTDAKTWGELKTQAGQEVNFSNIRGVVRETRNVLEIDDAALPEGDFAIFLFPLKVKSGMSTEMRTKAEYEKTFNSKQLRKMCSERGLGTGGSKSDFAKRLADDDKAQSIAEHNIKPDIIAAPLESKKPLKEVSTAVVAKETETNYATVESATVSAALKAKINDVNQLNSLLETLFPGMDVVSVDAVVDLKAELRWGGMPTLSKTKALPVKEVIKEEVKEEVEVVEEAKQEPFRGENVTAKKTDNVSSDTSKKGEDLDSISDDQLAKEGADLMKMFK